jgi:hypothetical protein
VGQPEEAQAPAIAERVLSPHAVELLFWGGVLVILGYFLYLPGGLHIAPWARLGRMLLLLGGAFTYGSLRRTPLARLAAFLLALCVLQALLMAGAWVVYVFHVGAGRLLVPTMVARFRCATLGLDLALLLLLHGAGRASRLGFALGAAFFPVASLALLAAPFVLGEPFWQNAVKWYAGEAAQSPAMALQIALTVFALIVLIKLYRLTHGPAGAATG